VDKKKIKQSPKLPAEERRRQLMDAAWRLFARKGYLATTTQEIATSAGVTKGALYFHFKTKEDLLFEIVKEWLTKARQAVVDASSEDMHPVDFLRILTLSHPHCEGDWAESAGLWIQAIRVPRIKAYATRQINEFLDFFVSRVSPERDLSKQQLRDLGLLIFALHDGLEMIRFHFGKKVKVESLIDLAEMLTDPGNSATSGKRESHNGAKKGKRRESQRR
jgi:AcrR family transcriptional regulator